MKNVFAGYRIQNQKLFSALLRCYPIVLILVFYSFESNVPFFHLASFDFLFVFDFQQFDYGILSNVCVCACMHAYVCIYSVLEFLAGHLSSVLENS